jgi:hypothetical protein
LPQTCKARAKAEYGCCAGPVQLVKLGPQDGAGTDQTHVALDYVEELRQLIETGVPKKPSKRCNPRVRTKLDRLFELVR